MNVVSLGLLTFFLWDDRVSSVTVSTDYFQVIITFTGEPTDHMFDLLCGERDFVFTSYDDATYKAYSCVQASSPESAVAEVYSLLFDGSGLAEATNEKGEPTYRVTSFVVNQTDLL